MAVEKTEEYCVTFKLEEDIEPSEVTNPDGSTIKGYYTVRGYVYSGIVEGSPDLGRRSVRLGGETTDDARRRKRRLTKATKDLVGKLAALQLYRDGRDTKPDDVIEVRVRRKYSR